jgi:hypothetical protein
LKLISYRLDPNLTGEVKSDDWSDSDAEDVSADELLAGAYTGPLYSST